MSSDHQPAGPPGTPERRRPGPTIDLKATEIASAPVTPQPGAQSAPSEDPAMTRTAQSQARPAGSSGNTAGRPDDAPPKWRTWLPPHLSWPAWLAWPAWTSSWPGRPAWPAIAAGAGGAALVALLLLGAYQLFGRAGDGSASAVEARVARLERQLQELAGRTPPPGVDTKVIDDLTSRLAKVEATVLGLRPAAIDPTLLNRIATVEGALKALDEKLGIVARRTDDISVIARDAREKADATAAALADLAQKVARLGTAGAGDATDNRIATLERTTKALEAELTKRGFGEAGGRAVRLAVTASALNAAVERGDAFVKELAAAKTLTDNAGLLAPLEPFASTGVPPAAALGRELQALLPTLAQAAGAVSREGGFLDRLQANAERLVRIRPVNEGPGDDPTTVLARLERKAAQADIAGAVAELGKLPPEAQTRAQAWTAKAQARIAAITASRRFAAESFAALAP